MIRIYRPPRDQRQIIKSRRNFLRVSPERFPQPALDPVPLGPVPGNPSANGTGEPADFATVGKHLDQQGLPAESFPLPQQTLEVRPGETSSAAESLLSGGQLRNESAPAFLAAALQHALAGLLGHAPAKTVPTFALQIGFEREVFLHARIVSAARDACQTGACVISSEGFALISS